MPKPGFVFDCDGTLLDTERVWSIAEESTVRQYDAPWSDDLKQRFIGRSVVETAELIADHAGVTGPRRAGVLELLTATFDGFVEEGHAVPTEGAEDLLRDLSKRGLPIGVVSNSPRKQVEAALRHAALIPWIDVLLCTDDGFAPKPAPDLYVEACDQLGIDRAISAAFEDAQTGIDAAFTADLYVIAVPGLVATSGAHRQVSTLADVDVDEVLAAAHREWQRAARP